MVLQEGLQRFQTLLGQVSVPGRLRLVLKRHDTTSATSSTAAAKSAATRPRRGRLRHRYHNGRGGGRHKANKDVIAATNVAIPHNTIRANGVLDVGRFALISIATLPFSLWVALFSYNYYYRVSLCQEALAKEDKEISFIRRDRYSSGGEKDDDDTTTTHTNSSNSNMIGRQRQLQEVQTLLSQPPHQILVVAGANESGKSRFVSEILKSVPLQRGITYLQLAQIADSLSTLTHAIVRAFDLRWLQMRHSLVDVLPFAGSEILVMKERFSDRDLAQALLVITEALKAKATCHKHDSRYERPVIIIDGLGEGSAWIRSPEGRGSLQRLLKWCIYITKERRLGHVILTGSEELVISLTGQNRLTRGHVKVIGLTDLTLEEAATVVRQEIPDATPSDIDKITDMFGGFIHDIQAVSREIQARLCQYSAQDRNDPDVRTRLLDDVISARFRLQVERVTAAFAKGRGEEEDEEDGGNNNNTVEEEEMDPYLDPLKAVYSEATAAENSDNTSTEYDDDGTAIASWSQLQLWQTLQRLVESDAPNMAVPFADLRDDVFEGDITPLLELMNEDVLGFEVESGTSSGGWSWEVKPATPSLGRVFSHLVNNSHLKERFQSVEEAQQSCAQKAAMERERWRLRRERKWLDWRKGSLQKTVDLANQLKVKRDRSTQRQLEKVYQTIVQEEVANEERGLQVRQELEMMRLKMAAAEEAKQKANKEHDARHGAGSAAGHVSGSRHDDHHHNKNSSSSSSGKSTQHDIQGLLKAAILHNYVQEGSKDKFERFRLAFEAMKVGGQGGSISAEDVVRLIKAKSGEDVDLEAARSFIRTWDLDNDTSLDYDEFVRMLLTDPKNSKMMKRKVTANS